MKNISILGSTGSIGKQALEVISHHNDKYNVVALSANTNIDELERQAIKFKPKIIAVRDKENARVLGERLKNHKIPVLDGLEGLIQVATEESADIVLTSVVGMVGLIPTLEAIKSSKTIALANKETLVTAGEIVIREANKNGVEIIPVDSEHSAIFQCLRGEKASNVSRLILTASGGPFRGFTSEALKSITVNDALKHPNWSMGKKITIDSATLMNKGLEVIEAKWLFDMNLESIDVLVHPQSIIHSMVEFVDGSIIAQLGVHDMKIPIQFALSYPDRINSVSERLDFIKNNNLTFELPDLNNFPCLDLAYSAIEVGGTMPSVLNATNEIVVDLFLNQKIKFNDIPQIISKIMGNHNNIKNPSLDDILEADKWAREKVFLDYNG